MLLPLHTPAVFSHDLIGNESNSSFFFFLKKKKLLSQPCAQILEKAIELVTLVRACLQAKWSIEHVCFYIFYTYNYSTTLLLVANTIPIAWSR